MLGHSKHTNKIRILFRILVASFVITVPHVTQAVTLSVVDPNNTAIGSYRWLIEEDTTYDIIPDVTCQAGDSTDCLAVKFHKSYMPVVAQGTEADPLPATLDPAQKYFISVLPEQGYTLSGASFYGSQADVTVRVNSQPVPLAQIRIFVFEDNFPINNAPDLPQENGLAGFKILLEDAGGRYGLSAQQIITDAYGNPLGTTYDSNGDVLVMGDGSLLSDADGIVTIQNIAPAKYGIQVVPPAGEGWVQTSTIEGSKVVDAWVKPDEAPYFTEFGPPGPHVFIGFTKEFTDTDVLTSGSTVTGTIRKIHSARPPEIGFFDGAPVAGCWVGLNESGINGRGLFAAPCNEDSEFTIPNVPPGLYQLVVWDNNLDQIFGLFDLSVDATGGCNGGPTCALGNVTTFSWFARLEQYVFNDENENGFWDSEEVGMPEVGTNIRWRDGTIYQSFPTDLGGAAPYDRVFPFFAWIVAEVDFARYKATGATMVVDNGGEIPAGNIWTFDGNLNPQLQPDNANLPYRVETGPVLTQAFQAFLGQTNVIQWGKKAYAPGENGGISGLVYYAVTRAEDDPTAAGAEVWEPGIPRIQVALYLDDDSDGQIDDLNGDLVETVADVDNAPFGNFPGPEDFDYNSNTLFDAGDAIAITTTDSWDDDTPTNCVGTPFQVDTGDIADCFDGLHNFNQVRPGLFDGGYAFDEIHDLGIDNPSSTVVSPIPVGDYIVGVGEHPVYEHVMQEDRNVDFGDDFGPPVASDAVPALTMPDCVGDDHLVPNEFSLFPVFDEFGAPVPPASAGETVPLCDRKAVRLTDGKNAAAEFFLFTPVPISGHIVGTALDDLANELDPNSPSFGEKYAPPYLPVSIKTYDGAEVTRTYTDRWGRFNALVPSTFTNNLPTSSGMSPNMLVACINDPGPVPDGLGGFTEDPNFNRQYSQFCYTLQYMPGTTTFLDTPVVPVAAFAGPNQVPLDCRAPDGTPIIHSVQGVTNAGPYVENVFDTVTITAAIDPAGRDFGFGSTAGAISVGGVPSPFYTWTPTTIQLAVPNSGRIEIVRGDNGRAVQTSVYVTVGGGATFVPPGGSIQQAVDLAQNGDLIIVPPGNYDEHVVMWKPVRLQGSGAGTVIEAGTEPQQKTINWTNTTNALITNGDIDLLPGQTDLLTESYPGIFVAGKAAGDDRFMLHDTRINGFSINGGSTAGGIVLNSYAKGLDISDMRIFNNYGIYGGGIRSGHPLLDGHNANRKAHIHHNYIAENGASQGVGAGVSLYEGSEFYKVEDNFICGNFTQGNGAGIGHFGNLTRGEIRRNTIIYNQSFNQGVPVNGGGIYIGGIPNNAGLTEGAGKTIKIEENLIQGNYAGAGDGGGISSDYVTGQRAIDGVFPSLEVLHIFNNMIVNNVAGKAGGAISLRDTPKARIYNNTIAHNNSMATAGAAFAPGSPNESTPQPAGIVSYQHSPLLLDAFVNNTRIGGAKKAQFGIFSNPSVVNTILYRNRSFFFQVDTLQNPPTFGLVAATPEYQDLGVLETGNAANMIKPRFSLVTDITGLPANNVDGSSVLPEDLFVAPFVNTANGETIKFDEPNTTIGAIPAFDEGGNFIDVRFGPLELTGDYHLVTGSVAAENGDGLTTILTDIDGDPRPFGTAHDIGADEHE